MARDDSEPRGDLADQATDSIFAAEQAAIAAALSGREPEDESARAGRVRPIPDEPLLDLGDVDDSDDAVHVGGDDIALSPAGAPHDEERDPHQLALDDGEDAFRPLAQG